MNWLPLDDEGEGVLRRAPAGCLFLFYCLTLQLGLSSESFVLSVSVAFFAMTGWVLLGSYPFAKGSPPVLFLILAFSLLGGYSIFLRIHQEISLPPVLRGEGVVREIRPWGRSTVALADFKEGRFLLKGEASASLKAGDRIFVAAALSALKRAEDARGFDEKLYWRGMGVIGVMRPWKLEIRGTVGGMPRWRSVLDTRLQRLPTRTRGYLRAALLGEREEELQELHRQAGSVHLLAVSGFHVGIVAGIAWFFFRTLPFKFFLMSGSVWFYVVLAGGAPSAIRAAVMLQIVLLGRALGRPSDAFNGVCAAGALMLLWNPWLFWNIGWRFSILAVMVLTSAPSLFVAPLVWLITAPLAAWTFGNTPLAGMIVNVFALPIFAVLFPLALLFSLPVILGLPGGFLFAAVPEGLFHLWELLSSVLVFLFPWQVSYSNILLIGAVLPLGWLLAKASGFSPLRAVGASFFFCVFFCMFLSVI
ncbi:MAG: ComEC/Rec2 family competence protein [Synergistaceae bacterium]|nr:ComEC/Rec2 family competence protein [Synergistaceae bacterium]